MHEYPYLQWNMEVHQARLRAAYPHAADKIGAPVASGMQEYERLARLAQSQGGPLTEGGDFNINLITFQRTWLRPWAFFALEDKSLRDELLQLFPDGAYVRIRGRRLLRIAQRKYGRSLARAARAARRRFQRAPRARRFAHQRAGALQHALEFANGNLRIRHPADLRR